MFSSQMSYFFLLCKKSKFYYLYDGISFIQILVFFVVPWLRKGDWYSSWLIDPVNSHILNDYNSIFVLSANFVLL